MVRTTEYCHLEMLSKSAARSFFLISMFKLYTYFFNKKLINCASTESYLELSDFDDSQFLTSFLMAS